MPLNDNEDLPSASNADPPGSVDVDDGDENQEQHVSSASDRERSPKRQKKTRGKKGQAVRRTLATQMTPQWRVLDFPKGEFVVRDNQMWCSSCGVPINVEHKNFGANHL